MKITEEWKRKLLACADDTTGYTDMFFAIIVIDTEGNPHKVETIATRRWIVVGDADNYTIKYIDNDFNVIPVED